VVLVTNALQYLPHADNIIWMDEGAVRAQGTYSQLVEQGLNIAELVHVEVGWVYSLKHTPITPALAAPRPGLA
jgi:hypothetical protein